MKKNFLSLLAASILSSTMLSPQAFAAVPAYRVNMRVGLKGNSPIAIRTVAKPGKKTFISEISDDGQSETLVEVFAKKSQVNRRDGLFMDVKVTKRVRGVQKASERVQVFAPENQEAEFGFGAKGRTAGNLSLAVMAHQL